MKVQFKKAYLAGSSTGDSSGFLFLPTIAYLCYPSLSWKYKHILIFGWLRWQWALVVRR